MKHLSTLLSFLGILVGASGYAQYCTSNATSSADDLISNVVLNGASQNISNSSGSACATYTDFTSLTPADLLPTASYTLTITMSSCGGNWTKMTEAYIDYNQDQDFDDPGETIGFTTASSAVPFTASINFTVPANATPGSTRMRLVCEETGSAANIFACGTYTWGETEDYTVLIIPPALTVLTPDTLEVPCYGDSAATIGTFVAGGTAPYSYLWNTGDTTDTIFNMPAGTYSVIVTDDDNDMDTAYTVVIQPDSIASSASVVTDLICDYDESVAVATGSGGTSISGYLVDTTSANYNPDSSSTGTSVTGIGDDDVTADLDIGFSFVFFGDTHTTFNISSNGFITFDGQFSDNGCCGGEVIPENNAFEPNNQIAFCWDDLYPPGGGTFSYYTIGTAPNRVCIINALDVPYCCNSTPSVSAQVKLFESSNCIEIHTNYVNSASPATQGIENQDGTEAYVYPGRNGSAWSASEDFVSFCPVDSSGLLYTWSDGSSGATVTGLQPGTYTVTVSDFNGCFNTHEVTINAPVSALTSNLDVTDVSCFGAGDGVIDPGITGGVTPVTYNWSNSTTGATATDLGPGIYSVSAEDNVGCTIEVNNVMVDEPALLLAVVTSVTNVTCPGDLTGGASAVAAGGIPPYTFTWLPSGLTGQTVTGLTNGSQNLVVTDSNGCQSFASVAVLASSTTPNVDLGPDLFSSSGSTFTLNAGNHDSYLWSDNSTGSTLTVTESGTYYVVVTNEDGCTGTDTINVEIWPLGIEQLQNANIKVYPNPAQDILNIEMDAEISDVTINIFDSKGSLMMTKAVTNKGLNTLDVSEIPAGIYTLSIVNGESVSTHQLSITR